MIAMRKKEKKLLKEKGQEITDAEKKSWTERIHGRMEESYERKTAMVRSRHIERWNGLCGGRYTLENPVVHLEWELCDMHNQQLLMKGKREEFFDRAQLNDLERELYLTGKDYAGDPYTYIETVKLRKETGKAIKMVAHKRI